MDVLNEMRAIATRHAEPDSLLGTTSVPRLRLFRTDQPTAQTPNVYDPMFCLIISGSKRAFIGDETYEYAAGDALVVTVDLPVVGEVTQASSRDPYLAMALELHRPTLATMLLECACEHCPEPEQLNGFRVSAGTPELLDAACRLLRLLDHPSDARALAPLIEREVLYRLLTGPSGSVLRQVARADSRMSQVTRAVSWLRQNFALDYSADGLAEIAGMSVSSLNRHFRATTAMSPLEYQKRVRLQEARRLLLANGTDVASVGYAVGYGSVSQFTREYRRLFGAPPGRDAERIRGDAAAN